MEIQHEDSTRAGSGGLSFRLLPDILAYRCSRFRELRELGFRNTLRGELFLVLENVGPACIGVSGFDPEDVRPEARDGVGIDDRGLPDALDLLDVHECSLE